MGSFSVGEKNALSTSVQDEHSTMLWRATHGFKASKTEATPPFTLSITDFCTLTFRSINLCNDSTFYL